MTFIGLFALSTLLSAAEHLLTCQPYSHYPFLTRGHRNITNDALNACRQLGSVPLTPVHLLPPPFPFCATPRCDPSAVEPLVLPHMQTSSLSHAAGISSEGRWTPGADAAQFWWPHARWRRGSDRGVVCQRLQIVTKYNKWNDCSLYSSIFMSPSYQGSNDTAAPCYYIVKMSGIRVK